MSHTKDIVALWTGDILWNSKTLRGLALRTNRNWSLLEHHPLLGWCVMDQIFTLESLLKGDPRWQEAVDKILLNNLKPDYAYTGRACSCGAWSLYGDESKNHVSTCSYFDNYDMYLLPINAPKNNDNRLTCFICSQPTKLAAGRYNLCNNSKCKWYNK